MGRRMVWAIIVAAGRGRRLGVARPKALVPLKRRPLFFWSLKTLLASEAVDGVVMTVPAAEKKRFETSLAAMRRTGKKPVYLIAGGRRRQDSVRKGMEWGQKFQLSHDTILLIHDAARPLLDRDLITRCLSPFKNRSFRGCVVPVLPVEDTLKAIDGRRIVKTLDRAKIVRAQTPQALELGIGLAMHQAARVEGLVATDEAMLAEINGLAVRMIPGDSRNMKITTAWDLKMAERIGRTGETA
ncbi:MAG: 2-C-methyl-D-erythritol 4-phosphate cytidylyltransferase [Candidatus Eisenbacteria bacterium]|uniref:2-C-methyl-D-erythritol 4-phosphate cytidylyltransferase n=1 Tax=Eiseniibacteriota bacterium TaxID=2212470 RepID=A0A948S1E3_UNCEI|nr:2-C-methyl-D-erythritol 4-phosphate cytidylyltransferase [Candidatus Eisenbacteria bacterium]MBU2693102.1 2-C-methyl-D-erythritol 4-phosphate cytidylyltransferase [Candidatus Eisenbacteria bacterium]